MRISIALMAFMTATTVSSAATLRVPSDHASIQDALDAAASGDRVSVAAGHYVIQRSLTFRGKAIHLVSEAGPEDTVIEMSEPTDTDRASVFRFETQEGEGTIVEGFTIRGGTGFSWEQDNSGIRDSQTIAGAIFCGSDSRTRFVDNVIERNRSDHGVVAVEDGAVASFEGNRFFGNTGGGILALLGGRVSSRNDAFIENAGPAVRSSSASTLVVEGAVFHKNIGTNDFGVVQHNNADLFVLSGCTFTENRGAQNLVLMVIETRTEIVSIEGCTFRNNQAFLGGALTCVVSSGDPLRPLRITNTDFIENESRVSGGAIHVVARSSFIEIRRCRFIANSAKSFGGAISTGIFSNCQIIDSSFIGNRAGTGGAVWTNQSDVHLEHCTIVGNGARRGGGAFGHDKSVVLESCVVFANTPDDVAGAANVSFSCLGKPTHFAQQDHHNHIGNPRLVGWGRENLHIDADADEAGDGSPEKPFRAFGDALLAYSVDLSADSPCLDIHGVRPGVLASQVSDAEGFRVAVARLRPGRYQVGALGLLSVIGDDRARVILQGSLYGFPSGSRLENLTATNWEFDVEGGGMVLADGDDVRVRSCLFTHHRGYVVRATEGSAAVFDHCEFRMNTGGSVVLSTSADLSFVSCRILNHLATEFGFGAFTDSSVSLENCLIAGVHCIGVSPSMFRLFGSELRLTHCTIADNTPVQFVNCDDHGGGSVAQIENCLLGNVQEEDLECQTSGRSLTFFQSPFLRPSSLDFDRRTSRWIGAVEFEFPDFFVEFGDYRLAKDSPAIDYGLPEHGLPTDLDGNERPCGKTFDVGAYEAECAKASRFRRGDTDSSGALNLADAIISLQYVFLDGSEPPCLDAADSNDDGRLSLADSLITLRHLFSGGPSPEPPFKECGEDPTDDPLNCGSSAECAI